MGSSRFPGKPLVRILGLPMIEHVRRRVSLCTGLQGVYVATCDEQIRDVVNSYGGNVIMTSPAHERATDRIGEAASGLVCDVVTNVQGDEPTVLPQAVELLVAPLADRSVLCSCLVYPITDPTELDDVNIIKTVLSTTGSVLYFSRSPIPSMKRGGGSPPLYKQSGMMAFQKEFLHKYAQLEPTPLEAAESVDLLRILEHDYRITAVVTPLETLGVDVPEDVPRVERAILENDIQRSIYEKIKDA